MVKSTCICMNYISLHHFLVLRHPFFSFLYCSLTSCENQDDSYATIFHPVMSDARVAVPSHFKRFSMKMFTFAKDDEILKDEVKTCAAKWGVRLPTQQMGLLHVALRNKSCVHRFTSTVMQWFVTQTAEQMASAEASVWLLKAWVTPDIKELKE